MTLRPVWTVSELDTAVLNAKGIKYVEHIGENEAGKIIQHRKTVCPQGLVT